MQFSIENGHKDDEDVVGMNHLWQICIWNESFDINMQSELICNIKSTTTTTKINSTLHDSCDSSSSHII